MVVDGGQGMVNNLVDFFWVFKLCVIVVYVYDFVVCFDMYLRNFFRFVEKGVFSCLFLCLFLCCVFNMNSIFMNFFEECYCWKNCMLLYSMFLEFLM